MDFIIEMKRHNIFSGNQAEQQTEGGYDGGVSVARYHPGEEARYGRRGLPLPGAGRFAGKCPCTSGLVHLNSGVRGRKEGTLFQKRACVRNPIDDALLCAKPDAGTKR